MEQNLDFPLSLKDIAIKLHIPPRSLSHICKQVFGQSPMRLYLRIRLQAARNFLFYEEKSVKDVLIACGKGRISPCAPKSAGYRRTSRDSAVSSLILAHCIIVSSVF